MKRYSIVFCLLYVLVLISFFVGCVSRAAYKYYPTQQVQTDWSTIDDTVHFSIGETSADPVCGYLETESGRVNVKFDMGPLTTAIFVYLDNDEKISEPLEVWQAKKIKKDSLTVFVEQSTYFNVGETIIIYRNK